MFVGVGAARIRDLEHERVHRWERPLPDRVLEHHRDDVPPQLDGARPQIPRRRHEEVREDEDEGAGGHRARMRGEELECLGDVVRWGVEGGGLELAVLVLPERLALRRQPERLAAVAQIEVADEPVCLDGARAYELQGRALCLGLSEPRQPGGRETHLRPPVAHDDDARRLLGELLTHDERVVAARGGEPCGRRPVDRLDLVPGRVGAGARDVRAASAARAAQRPEGEADDPTPRDERERDVGQRTPTPASSPRPPSSPAAPAPARRACTRHGTRRARRASPSASPARGRRAGS